MHVACVGTRVVGMVESNLQDVAEDGPRLPPGRWGYLNSVGVTAGHRGGGVGTALVRRALADLEAAGATGHQLWFSAYNPASTAFWTGHGFRPLWTRYQAVRR